MLNEVTVASTTDSQAEVNAAAGIVEEPTSGAAEQESAEIAAESQTAQESNEEHEEESGEAGKPSKRSQKVKRLATKLTEAERERDEWRQKFEQLQSGRAEQPKEKPATDPFAYPVPKPKASDFENPQDFVEALTDWKAEEREYRNARKAEAEQAEVSQKEVFDAYNLRVAEARAEYEDFEEVVGKSNLKIWPEVQHALMVHKKGPDLVYHLAKNPEVAEQLAEMSPAEAVVELGVIAANLKAPVAQSPKPRVTPIKPVGGGTTRTAVDKPDELPYSEWKKWLAANYKK